MQIKTTGFIWHNHHHKHQGSDPLIRSVSKVTTALSNIKCKTETFGQGSTTLQKTGMFGGHEVSYHQTYSVRDWLSILRTPYPTQNLQRKHRT